ncbi:hypothetical protein V6N13_118367 [Hibiscus sabdariffa]
MRNWKLRGGENRLSGLLEGHSSSIDDCNYLERGIPQAFNDLERGIPQASMIVTTLRGAFLKPCNDLERGIPQALFIDIIEMFVKRAVTRPRRSRENRVRDSALETPREPCPRP